MFLLFFFKRISANSYIIPNNIFSSNRFYCFNARKRSGDKSPANKKWFVRARLCPFAIGVPDTETKIGHLSRMSYSCIAGLSRLAIESHKLQFGSCCIVALAIAEDNHLSVDHGLAYFCLNFGVLKCSRCIFQLNGKFRYYNMATIAFYAFAAQPNL